MTTRTPSISDYCPDGDPCSWQIVEPPTLPLVQWWLDRIDRDIGLQLGRMEEMLVDVVTDAWFDREPFDLLELVRDRCVGRHVTDVAVNTILAASHQVRPSGRASRQVDFLATACPTAMPGAGWLRRLGQRLGAPPRVWKAASDVIAALDECASTDLGRVA